MSDMEKVINGLETCINRVPGKYTCNECPYEIDGNDCDINLAKDILAILKERDSNSIKPTINEYGEAYCICGENVGVIPSNKNLPSVLMKYCPGCGRRMNWNDNKI